MFGIKTRKIIGDVLARKGRTALVSLAIFIGVTGTITLFSLSDIIVRQLREDVQEEELSMLSIFLSLNEGTQPDDAAYLERFSQVEGVTDVMGTVQGLARFIIPDDETTASTTAGDEAPTDDEPEFEDSFITAYTVPFEDGLPIEPMRLLSGRYPQPGANEVVIETRMADDKNLALGDAIMFRILSPSRNPALNGEVGTVETWTISGIVFHPYIGANNNGGFSVEPEVAIYGLLDDARYIGGTNGLTTIQARFETFEQAEEQESTFTRIIADETPYITQFSQPQDPADNPLIMGAQTLGATLGTLAFIALLVSGFLVINVISSLVLEQRQQIGVMKSIGATRPDNIFMYSGIAFAYGFIAVIPGVIVGIPAGNAAAQALAPTLNTVLDGFQISVSSIILGVIVGLLIPVLASILPVYFGTRVTILESLSDFGIDARYGGGILARIIEHLPVPITVRQGFSNVSQKKSRLLFTVITLSIAAGAFIGIFGVFSSLTTGINSFLDTFNVEIGIFSQRPSDSDDIANILNTEFRNGENNIIASIEPGFQYEVEFDGYEPEPSTAGPPGIFAYGYDVTSENPAFSFTVDEGDLLNAENAANGVIFSNVLAANMDVGIGDTVTMRVPAGTLDVQIVGISEFPVDQIWIDWRTLAEVAGFTEGGAQANRYFTELGIDGYTGSLSDNRVTVLGLDTQFADFIPFTDGEFFTPNEAGIIINSDMAERGGYNVGDVLTLRGATSGDFTVTGIFELPPQFTAGLEDADIDVPPDFAAMFLPELLAVEGVSPGGEPLPQGLFVITTLDDPSIEDIDNVIDDINERMISNGITAFNFNFPEFQEQISQAFFTIQAVLQLVAGLIALVGALGLLTTLSMSVFERQKEIGVMRSIGAGSLTVATQFLTEGLLVGVIAWLVGLPLGFAIQTLLLSVTGFDEVFEGSFPLVGAIIGLIGLLVITFIASLWPSLAAARKTVADILRYQ